MESWLACRPRVSIPLYNRPTRVEGLGFDLGFWVKGLEIGV